PQGAWVALSACAGAGIALPSPWVGAAAVVEPGVQGLTSAAVGGVAAGDGEGFGRGGGGRGDAGLGGEALDAGGAVEDRADFAGDLGQVQRADARKVGQQLRVGVRGNGFGDDGVESIDAGLQRSHDRYLRSDQLRDNGFVESAGGGGGG